MKAMDTNDRLASKHNRRPGQDGNRYVLTRRQERAVAQRGNVPTSEQDQAESDYRVNKQRGRTLA